MNNKLANLCLFLFVLLETQTNVNFKLITVLMERISQFPIHRMVSRRKILSRSRDDLHLEQPPFQPEDEEDVWYQKDKLFKVSESKIFTW